MSCPFTLITDMSRVQMTIKKNKQNQVIWSCKVSIKNSSSNNTNKTHIDAMIETRLTSTSGPALQTVCLHLKEDEKLQLQ